MPYIEISAGELIDKVTILEIKQRLIADPEKLRQVEDQLQALAGALADVPAGAELDVLKAELLTVNETIWGVEDGLRDHERRADFGPSFTRLARAVYHNNDRRAEIKGLIDLLAGSRLTEAKSYSPYRRNDGGHAQ